MKVFREKNLTLNIRYHIPPYIQRNFDCEGENTLLRFATPTVSELDRKMPRESDKLENKKLEVKA